MTADRLVASRAPGEIRIALLAGARPLEVRHHRAGGASRVGEIVFGRVVRVVPSLEAAFVEIGEERPGFLNARGAAIARTVREGEAVIVEITRDAVAAKGARLNLRPRLLGRLLVYAPAGDGVALSPRILEQGERARLAEALRRAIAPGEGITARTRAAGADEATLLADLAALRERWRAIAERAAGARPPAVLAPAPSPLARALAEAPALRRIDVDDPALAAEARAWFAEAVNAPAIEGHHGAPLFEALGIEAAIAAALEPCVRLPSGGGLVIEETEALTAIDVNVHGAQAVSAPAALRRVDLEAAQEIAHQLRLRRIGGLVVVDFVPLADAADRRRLLGAFRRALAPDRAASPPDVTRLGLIELTRRREGPSLAETLCGPRDACAGRRRPSAETVALEIARRLSCAPAAEAVIVAPEVAAALRERRLLAALAERGQRIALRSEPTRARRDYTIVTR